MDQINKQQGLLVWLSHAATQIRTSTRTWFWQGLAALLVICLIVGFVRPFARSPNPDADDVAASWNKSMSRLGILPMFPPAEDFYVGDVWAVVADAQEIPLLGKAVRVAHIDLREEMQKARNRQPIFADTASNTGNAISHQQSTEVSEVSDKEISLTLTAFPGFTITHTTRATGSLGWNILGFGAEHDRQQIEEIRIPVAETYGVPYADAFVRLDAWCTDAATAILCSDKFLRRLIAYSVSPRILAARNGSYTARLQLILVTRVFLAREIEQRRLANDTGGAVLQARTTSASAVPPVEPAVKIQENTSPEQRSESVSNSLKQNADAAVLRGTPFATASAILAGGAELMLRQVFQRPVAFGYRAVTIDVPPSTPASEIQR
jgi:hypothetical protein